MFSAGFQWLSLLRTCRAANGHELLSATSSQGLSQTTPSSHPVWHQMESVSCLQLRSVPSVVMKDSCNRQLFQSCRLSVTSPYAALKSAILFKIIECFWCKCIWWQWYLRLVCRLYVGQSLPLQLNRSRLSLISFDVLQSCSNYAGISWVGSLFLLGLQEEAQIA